MTEIRRSAPVSYARTTGPTFQGKGGINLASPNTIGNNSEKTTFRDEERDAQQREEFRNELAKTGETPIVFVDECGIKNDITNEYGRAPRGVKIIDNKKGRATETLNLIAGRLEGERIAPRTYDCYTHTDDFNAWLEQGLIPVLPPHCIIVLDHARFHKSARIVEIIQNHGHQLLFLPAYSPDLNPIETCWAVIKRKLRNLLILSNNIYSAVESVFQTN